MFTNIRLALYGVAVLTVVAVGVWLYRSGHTAGVTETRAAYDKAFKQADQNYRAKEKEHEKFVQDLRLEFARKQAVEDTIDRQVIATLNDGSRRLRLLAASCSRSSSTGATTNGTDVPGEAELAPKVAAELYSIAADGDSAIRKLGMLQAWAAAAVKLCNGGK